MKIAGSLNMGLPCDSAGKESACNVGDLGLIPGLERSPGEGKGYPLQYSSLENSMDFTVHVVAESRKQLSNFHFHFFLEKKHHYSQGHFHGKPDSPWWNLPCYSIS